ncbi:uncharacterized protein PHA67_011883 [Liasis olivaceus]
MANSTGVKDFYLTELSDLPEVHMSLFAVILMTYLTTLAGNGAILIATATDAHLQTPMYFFLSNLSLLDVLCPTVTVPKMLQTFLSEDKRISFVGCMLQLFFLIDVVGTEIFLLAVMAYDRYVAICSPLHYTNIMSKRLCAQLAAGTWLTGFTNSMIHTSLTFTLSFCGPNKVNQYYCDIPPMMALSCSSTYLPELVLLLVAGILGGGAFLVTLISYIYIILAILRMRSAEGRQKAFSTCGSHLTVVCLFYGTTIATYVRPTSTYSPKQDRIVSMLYGILTPMINPMIYSLRNKEVKKALVKAFNLKGQPVIKIMDQQNESIITEFILQGFTDNPKTQFLLFMVFLSVYAITVLGNLGMILLICTQPQLHKPMYYFLGNLSFVDLCCSSTIAPKMLSDLLSATKRISYSACATQLFLFSTFSDVAFLSLAVMAYDRYVAICNPLLYSNVMSKKTCQQLITVVYFTALLDSIISTYYTFRLSFCNSNIINHFFCDEPPLLILSCSERYITEIVLFTICGFFEAGSIGMFLVSYVSILATILKMRSAEGRSKAFSTCASHLTAVGLLHGTILYMYFRPSSSYSMDQDKWASVFYTVVIPMLNPLIYSLRNKEVKDALTKSVGNLWEQVEVVARRPFAHLCVIYQLCPFQDQEAVRYSC